MKPMSNIMQLVRDQISNMIENAVQTAGYGPAGFTVEIPRERANGDFSSNAAMLLAREAKMPPRAVADKLSAAMDTEGTYVDRVEIAGPGFINFYLNKNWLFDVLPLIEDLGERYGEGDLGKGQKVMIEFVSANPTGPMHMGNARGGALGDSMANVLSLAGFEVTREFYLNDSGNQIEKFACSLEARYLQQCGAQVEFSPDWYQGEDISQRAAQFRAIHGDRFADIDSQERKQALTAFALEKNVEMMKQTLENYRIGYDVWFRESDLYQSGEVDEVLRLLTEGGHTYEKDGALWLRAAAPEEKDEVLVRANGVPTYFAADIAYHRNKFATRGFDRVINIWGADHHGHVARMKHVMDALGIDSARLEVVLMQLVRLMRGGEVARMSKRSGKSITLDVLLEEIGIDAARFFFNMRNAGSHFDFDLDLAVEQNNENPVFYVQYAHARICSIIRLLQEEGVSVGECAALRLALLQEPAEEALLRRLAEYPDEIRLAASALEPAKLTRYAMDLANDFHSFYNACRVNVEDAALRGARLKLINSTRVVLKNVLTLLAVTAPEKM